MEKSTLQAEVPVKSDKKPLTPRTDEERTNLVNRLKRIEGQVRGIQKMIEEERYCVDVLVQITAVNNALKKVGMNVLERHTNHCVSGAIKSGDGDAAIDELMKVIEQFSRA